MLMVFPEIRLLYESDESCGLYLVKSTHKYRHPKCCMSHESLLGMVLLKWVNHSYPLLCDCLQNNGLKSEPFYCLWFCGSEIRTGFNKYSLSLFQWHLSITEVGGSRRPYVHVGAVVLSVNGGDSYSSKWPLSNKALATWRCRANTQATGSLTTWLWKSQGVNFTTFYWSKQVKGPAQIQGEEKDNIAILQKRHMRYSGHYCGYLPKQSITVWFWKCGMFTQKMNSSISSIHKF